MATYQKDEGRSAKLIQLQAMQTRVCQCHSTRPFCRWCCGGAAWTVVPFSVKKAFISPPMSFMSKSVTTFLGAKPISTTSCLAAASRLEVRFLIG
eukprot:11599568-Ditylum_brightwellii.AAC.1